MQIRLFLFALSIFLKKIRKNRDATKSGENVFFIRDILQCMTIVLAPKPRKYFSEVLKYSKIINVNSFFLLFTAI